MTHTIIRQLCLCVCMGARAWGVSPQHTHTFFFFIDLFLSISYYCLWHSYVSIIVITLKKKSVRAMLCGGGVKRYIQPTRSFACSNLVSVTFGSSVIFVFVAKKIQAKIRACRSSVCPYVLHCSILL